MKHDNIKLTFAKYVSLNIIGMAGLSCYILADTYFVAVGVGADGLTALNLAIPVYSFINGAGLMIGMGGATRFTLSGSRSVFTQSLWYAAAASCLFVLVGTLLPGQLADLLGADPATRTNVVLYLRTILCFAPMFLLNNIVLCFVRNDGNPRLSMTAMLVSSLSNILLDYLFVFPLGMGMLGAALATAASPVIGLLCLSAHFVGKQNGFGIVRSKPQPRSFADISSLGVPALITELSAGIVIIVFNMIILRLAGNTGVAAYGIVANIALVVIAIFTGISQGMQPIISLCHSRRDNANIDRVMKYGFVCAISIAAVVYLLSVVFTGQIVAAFNKDGNEQLAKIAINGVRIYFVSFVFAGINILSASYFSSCGKPRNAFIISLMRGFVVIIPSALLLAVLFGMNGVWVSMTFTELAVLLMSIGMLRRARHSQRSEA